MLIFYLRVYCKSSEVLRPHGIGRKIIYMLSRPDLNLLACLRYI